MRRFLLLDVVLLAGALCACQPANTAKPEVFSELTCLDGKPWNGRQCGGAELPTVEIAPMASGSASTMSIASLAETESHAKVPSFLDLGVDPKKRFPLRAKVRRNGTIYERRDGGILDQGDDRPLLWPELVIDPDRDHTPRRPRLLCIERNHRVAVHRDAEDLMLVALAGALVVPTQQLPSQVTDLTPGVRLAAGTTVMPLPDPKQVQPKQVRPKQVQPKQVKPKHGMRQISFDGILLDVRGWVDAARLDVVFEPKRLKDNGVRDGELTRNVDLKDSPTGRVVATLATAPKLTNRLLVKVLSAPRSGHVLVRFNGSGEAQAVGWVPTNALRRFPPKRFMGGGGGGASARGLARPVTLTKETLLRSDASKEILGIVTRDGQFSCQADCESDEPLVKVGACAGNVPLRATRK